MSHDPRWKNGNYRRGVRARFKAQGLPCHICKKPIDYSLPSSDMMSMVVDEIIPISKATYFGYDSQEAACRDPDNLAPAHKLCNLKKGAKVGYRLNQPNKKLPTSDGNW